MSGLHCKYEKYLDYKIYTTCRSNILYADIYWNGTCLKGSIKAISYEKLVAKCKDIIDDLEVFVE